MSEVERLKAHVINAVYKADNKTSKAKPKRINTEIKGFSSTRIRHLLNNLCSLENCNYLDVGSYRGSTVISAVWDNDATGYAVDTFNFDMLSSETTFHPQVKKALEDLLTVFNIQNKVNIIVKDIAKINKKDLNEQLMDVVYYDSSLNAKDIQSAVKNILPNTKIYSILVFANTQNSEALAVFEKAIIANLATIHYSLELKSRVIGDSNTWWNGVKIFVVERKRLAEEVIAKQKELKNENSR